MNKEIDFSIISKKEFVDIPASTPFVKSAIPKVGITNRPRYFNIIDPFTKENIRLLSSIKVFLNLPDTQRGLHMSRIENEFNMMDQKETLEIKELAKSLCENIKNSQNQRNCTVELSFQYELLVNKNLSARVSSEIFNLLYSYSIKDSTPFATIGLKAPIINACPCTQRWGIREFYFSLKEAGFSEEDIDNIIKSAPLQSHTNRGTIILKISNDKITFSDLYEIIENSSPILRELLNNKDEHYLVKEAQENGLFCEDVLRNVIKNVKTRYHNKIISKSNLNAIVEIEESIHHHNLYAEINSPICDINI